MPNCILFDVNNNPVNVIFAELSDVVPEGFCLELVPDDAIWDGSQIIIQTPVDEVI